MHFAVDTLHMKRIYIRVETTIKKTGTRILLYLTERLFLFLFHLLTTS